MPSTWVLHWCSSNPLYQSFSGNCNFLFYFLKCCISQSHVLDLALVPAAWRWKTVLPASTSTASHPDPWPRWRATWGLWDPWQDGCWHAHEDARTHTSSLHCCAPREDAVSWLISQNRARMPTNSFPNAEKLIDMKSGWFIGPWVSAACFCPIWNPKFSFRNLAKYKSSLIPQGCPWLVFSFWFFSSVQNSDSESLSSYLAWQSLTPDHPCMGGRP